MSAISGSSTYMEQLLAQKATDASGGIASGDARGVGSDRFKSRFEEAAKAAGVDPSKFADLEKQIQAAIQGVDSAGADKTTDRRAAIRDAIHGVLKQNGVDIQKFDQAFHAHRGHAHHSKRPSDITSPSNIFAPAPDPDNDGDQHGVPSGIINRQGAVDVVV